MSYIENVKEEYISAQWGSFIAHAVVNLDVSRETYVKNRDSERYKNGRRKAIAVRENIPASISVVLLNSALDGLTNATAFWQKKKNFNQWKSLEEKISSVVSLNKAQRQAVSEFSTVRDAIIHGHLWIKVRRYKQDYSFRFVKSYLWSPFKKMMGSKFKKLVDLNNRTTKQFKFSVIPIDVNFVDALNGLVLVGKVLDLLDWGKNFRIHNLEQMGFSKKTSKITSKNFGTLENRITYFSRFLEGDHDKPVFENLLKAQKNATMRFLN